MQHYGLKNVSAPTWWAWRSLPSLTAEGRGFSRGQIEGAASWIAGQLKGEYAHYAQALQARLEEQVLACLTVPNRSSEFDAFCEVHVTDDYDARVSNLSFHPYAEPSKRYQGQTEQGAKDATQESLHVSKMQTAIGTAIRIGMPDGSASASKNPFQNNLRPTLLLHNIGTVVVSHVGTAGGFTSYTGTSFFESEWVCSDVHPGCRVRHIVYADSHGPDWTEKTVNAAAILLPVEEEQEYAQVKTVAGQNGPVVIGGKVEAEKPGVLLAQCFANVKNPQELTPEQILNGTEGFRTIKFCKDREDAIGRLVSEHKYDARHLSGTEWPHIFTQTVTFKTRTFPGDVPVLVGRGVDKSQLVPAGSRKETVLVAYSRAARAIPQIDGKVWGESKNMPSVIQAVRFPELIPHGVFQVF